MVNEKWVSHNQSREIPKLKMFWKKLLNVHENTNGEVKVKKENGVLQVELNSLEKYVDYENAMREETFSSFEFFKNIGYKGTMAGKKLDDKIIQLSEQGKLSIRHFDYPIYLSLASISEFGILKSELERLKNDYIRTDDVLKMLSIKTLSTFKKYVEDHNIDCLKFTNLSDMTFYNKKDIEKLLTIGSFIPLNEKTKIFKLEGHINRKEVTERFRTSSGGFDIIKQEESLESMAVNMNGFVYYPISFIEEIERKAKKLNEKISDDYYRENEVLSLIGRKSIPKSISKDKFYVPLLIRCFFKGKDESGFRKQFVYPKTSVHTYFDSNAVEEIYDNPYMEFEHNIKKENIVFPAYLSETKRIWFRFVKEQTLSSAKNETGKKHMVKACVKETKFLASISHEIYNMSEKELNFLFLNSKNAVNFRIDMYKFLRYFQFVFKAEGKRIFNADKLKSPYDKKSNGSKKDVSIYSYEEYRTFFDYANDLKLHKQNSMNSISEKNNQYNTSWLYVLLHLNNSWRSYDAATSIPRIEPEKVGISSIDELMNRDLTLEEANKIINQMKQYYMQHGKTGKQRRFFCSSHLMISMATALCICEFKTRIVNPTSFSLSEFNNKNKIFTASLQKQFFSEFKQELRFESRKMNRTLLTFTDSVIRKHTGGNSLESTKYLRGHDSIETTNIYVQIPQEHLDFLTDQLFARDSFGYVPELFAKLLYGTEENFETRTSQIYDITEKLGNVYKLEWMSGVLNQFKEEKDLVDKLFETMDDDEMKELHTKMTLELLPSKEENFQCLVSESNCVYPMRDCHNCALSMPNYYAISSICNRVLENIVLFNHVFENTSLPAEKTKLANFLHRDLQLLQNAMKKFGKEEVYHLLDIEAEVFKEALKHLPSHKQYITSRKGV